MPNTSVDYVGTKARVKRLKGYVYDFSVDYDAIVVSDICFSNGVF